MRFQIRVTEMLQPGHKIRTVGASDADVQKRPMQPIYALNLFNIANREEYLAYSRRSAREVRAHGGRVIALGRFQEAVLGEVAPRSVMILVEWESRAAFDSYCQDSNLAGLHSHRVKGTADYVWHLFDRLEDLRPLLKAPGSD